MELVYYLLVLNAIAFTLMGIDKHRAKKQQRRIPERTLFLPVFLGGGIGGCCGMWVWRHKTKHTHFQLGFPFITVVEYVCLCLAMSL